MKRILSVVFMAALAGAGTLQAAESPSPEACVRYAEADYDYELDVTPSLVFYMKAAYQAAYKVGIRKMDAVIATAQSAIRVLYMTNTMTKGIGYADGSFASGAQIDSAIQEVLIEMLGIYETAYVELEAIHQNAHKEGMLASEAILKAAELKWLHGLTKWFAHNTDLTSFQTPFSLTSALIVNRLKWLADNPDLESLSVAKFLTDKSLVSDATLLRGGGDAEAAAQDAEAEYKAVKQEAHVVRSEAYLEIYDGDDGIRSIVPAVMESLRHRHRNLCLELYDL